MKATLVSAPAGSGKTVRLVQEYLRRLHDLPVESIVAITFTRRAAAELVDRVGRVLRVAAGLDQAPSKELQKLYGPHMPPEAEAKKALEALPAAPVSTVDAFVLRLLQEHLLDAALPVGEGGRAWLDGPLVVEGAAGSYEAAAREVLDGLSPEAQRLLRHATVKQAAADVATLAQAWRPERPRLTDFAAAYGRALVKEMTDHPDCWADLQLKQVNKDGKSAFEEAAAWLAEPVGTPPLAVVVVGGHWANRGSGKQRRADCDAALDAAMAAVGLGHAPLPEKGLAFVGDPAETDALADALLALAAETRTRVYRQMALDGRLGYVEALEAATELCRTRGADLRRRFRALLVDEVQDTNPAQLEFYRKFAGLGEPDALHTFFVGDIRQSIYRFRGADPEGWKTLFDDPHVEAEELTTNWRSSRLLVGAQKALFNALAGVAPGVAAARALESGRPHDGGRLEGTRWPAPVVVVDGQEEAPPSGAALEVFRTRLEEAAAGESAAVLVKTWRSAESAAAYLRQRGVKAQVTGQRGLLSGGVARDLRAFLRALIDPSDPIAAAAVLKHPSVGVSDAGLVALAPRGRFPSLNRALPEDRTLAQLDTEALDRARPHLARARQAIGRRPTGEVLERLVADLQWRPLLAAGPGDREAVAQLDILLERVREAEADGTDPFRVLERLDPERAESDDLPPVRLADGAGVVEVMTIHSAKGLEWDHVVLPDGPAKGTAQVYDGEVVNIGRSRDRTLVGVRFDPGGGFAPVRDPIGALTRTADAALGDEEALRLFYVGVTRAKRSLVVALGQPSGRVSRLGEPIRSVLVDREGLDPDEAQQLAEAVEVVREAEVEVAALEPPPRPPTRRRRAPEAAWAPTLGRPLVHPSYFAETLSKAEAEAILEQLRPRVRMERGAGVSPFSDTLASLPPHRLGDVVHGWLEAWQFEGAPSPEDVRRYLDRRVVSAGDGAADALAAWLPGMGAAVEEALPGFRRLLEGTHRFEWPLVAVDGAVFTGRADLVLEDEAGRLSIVDFKSGPAVPESADDGALNGYLLQLECYRRMARAAGREVAGMGLLYLREPAWVWVQADGDGAG